MKTTINRSDFHEAFRRMGRDKHFSPSGLDALFDYLEDLEGSTGEEIELDVVALCCDYSEYENLEDFRVDYGDFYADKYESIDDVENHTTVIRIDWDYLAEDGAFIVQAF